jgi:hypothetical protein
MQRVFLPYWVWEEYKCGMWRNIYGAEREEYLQKAIKFTGNANLYGSWMMKVIKEWPYSCLHNLTCDGMNKQAWIGHAACCLAINCPEDITRLAWHNLTKKQQDKANGKADKAIQEWGILYQNGLQSTLNMI